jgi:hypothetical protein
MRQIQQEHCQNKQGGYQIHPVVAVQMNSSATHTMKYSQPAVTKPMAVRKFTIIHLFRIAGLPSAQSRQSEVMRADLSSQVSWSRRLGLQSCFSNANPMPQPVKLSHYLRKIWRASSDVSLGS